MQINDNYCIISTMYISKINKNVVFFSLYIYTESYKL